MFDYSDMKCVVFLIFLGRWMLMGDFVLCMMSRIWL